MYGKAVLRFVQYLPHEQSHMAWFWVTLMTNREAVPEWAHHWLTATRRGMQQLEDDFCRYLDMIDKVKDKPLSVDVGAQLRWEKVQVQRTRHGCLPRGYYPDDDDPEWMKRVVGFVFDFVETEDI